jgi:hypothetical protein
LCEKARVVDLASIAIAVRIIFDAACHDVCPAEGPVRELMP